MITNDTKRLALDEQTMRLIEEKFEFKRRIGAARERELFGIFDEALTDDERLALKYLYAYMPLNDMADYDGSLFLSHVRHALRIRSTVPWGSQIPDSVFFHFVLPYRVNNENIEDFRGLLFDEIYPRVKHMSMQDAVLETNHWCHEKANYIGCDPRTVSPLTLMRTALGRCGEHSTLAVAALRSIGIPARQVYTPRWAHCDSNHAWVEAWADGTWHFLGACEPEPRLNQGWFRRPARRAMLVHTRVAANYPGPEEVTLARPWYSELNLMKLYTEPRTLTVRVIDAAGRPAQAKVDFQVYNFAELSTIVPMSTNEDGEVSVTLGLGDVYISACGSDGWGFAKCTVGQTDEVTVRLTKEIASEGVVEFDMAPPPDLPDAESESITEQEKAANDIRVKQGAKIRSDYEATFLTEEDANAVAFECNLDPARVWSVLKKARGNSREIASFLREQSPVYGEWSLRLLEVLNDKDLNDTFRDTLQEHLVYAMEAKKRLDGTVSDELFASCILRPRADYEMITEYRAFFRGEFGEDRIRAFAENPLRLVEYIDRHVEIVEDLTHYKGAATPAGTFRLKKGDRQSRNILFVAAARSAGIPARLEPSDKRPQYWSRGSWHDVRFGGTKATPDEAPANIETGSVVWLKDEESEEQAKYFGSFTVARFEEGSYKTLDFGFGKTDVFGEPFVMPAGHYRLTTGTRLEDGTALVTFRYFRVLPGEQISVPLTFRKRKAEVPVFGAASLDHDAESFAGAKQPLSSLAGRQGTLFAWIEPDREPSKHLLRELREMKAEWESLGVSIVLLVGEPKWNGAAALASDSELPNNVWLGKESSTFEALAAVGGEALGEAAREFPVVLAVDPQRRIRYRWTGYKLGIAKEVAGTFKAIAP
ncbi:transglutaminase domain-containing protein [Paenibacillus thermotolerans]|uniref:transglutaminase domain-containing protein n=1 Tax=Paenibacillus thermotolerans TaxID=3027807 RepID=UPI0023686848|nr:MULTISPECIES: transglutaminase domain-containing protein [unclassified Paenibacillus]